MSDEDRDLRETAERIANSAHVASWIYDALGVEKRYHRLKAAVVEAGCKLDGPQLAGTFEVANLRALKAEGELLLTQAERDKAIARALQAERDSIAMEDEARALRAQLAGARAAAKPVETFEPTAARGAWDFSRLEALSFKLGYRSKVGESIYQWIAERLVLDEFDRAKDVRDRLAEAALATCTNVYAVANQETVAKGCYLMADAMLHERGK